MPTAVAGKVINNFVLGANSYIGQHLAMSLVHFNTVLHTRNAPNHLIKQLQRPVIQEDLQLGFSECAKYVPETVYIVARPQSDEEKAFSDFNQNVMTLLRRWQEIGSIQRIVFLSTQLVYSTPQTPEPILPSAMLGPETAYDRTRLHMESFLASLAITGKLRSVEVYRLPLVSGGILLAHQRAAQYMSFWQDAYRLGWRWPVTKQTPDWGTSWVHVAHLAAHLAAVPKTGYGVYHPVSGNFTYRRLHEFLLIKNPAKQVRDKPLHLNKTYFFLKDTVGMPPLSIEDAYKSVV